LIRRYQQTLFRLLKLLHAFRDNPKDLPALAELQESLYNRLVTVERREAKAKRNAAAAKGKLRSGRQSREDSKGLRAEIKHFEQVREEYRALKLLIRTIGDGIAYTLFDRYDLKPLAFKESPGGIRGKKGRRRELNILRRLLSEGYSAVLCDLTNVLRYADICVDVGDSPLFFEVKTSKNTNARTDRQLADLEAMGRYLTSDHHPSLFGRSTPTKRVALTTSQPSYASEMNELIRRAKTEGTAFKEVELGLTYFAVHDLDTERLDAAVKGYVRSHVALLNEAKNDGTWASYYPYTLSIAEPEDIIAFAAGEITLIVLFDQMQVERIANSLGFQMRDLPPGMPDSHSGDWPFWFEPKAPDPKFPEGFGIGAHFLGRLFYEFTSLEWVVRETCARSPAIVQFAEELGVGESSTQIADGPRADLMVAIQSPNKDVRDRPTDKGAFGEREEKVAEGMPDAKPGAAGQ
jgi:hypothetical protein